jgi:Pectate lyase superfamily protein
MKTLLRVAAFIFGIGIAPTVYAQSPGSFSTLSTTGTTMLGGDALMCSGRPWIDVRCPGMAGGAVGDDSHDDTAAIKATIAAAVAGGFPVQFPAGTYKVTSQIAIDYAGQAPNGFRLISRGARIDGRTIASGPVLQVECSGGTPASPSNCFYFKEEGSLFVDAATPAYAVAIGKADFSDAQNSLKIDHLLVNNASTAPAAGGCQFNYLLDADIYAVCDSAGGAAGMAFEQTQFSRISGAGSAAATGGRGIVLEGGYDFSNTFSGLDLEVSPTCLSITFPHNGLNTFISPFFNCTTAVNATASIGNTLVNPNYGGAVINYGPVSTGVAVLGSGSRSAWLFPASANYTAAPIDDGLSISSYNAPGSSMNVTLPPMAAINPGWSMGFATDNGKGMTVTVPDSARILSGGKNQISMTIPPSLYEYVRLQADRNNWRVVSSTRNTRLGMGWEPPPWPSNWLYPSTSGYAATLADNGNIVSSYGSSAGLAVTLPPTTALPVGWSMGFATDNSKPLSIQVNGVEGGRIIWPGSGASSTALSMAVTSQGAYEFAVLAYDGSGNFRVVNATPATAQAIGMIGAASISHWSFPAVSAYSAGVADNGGVVSNYNSPLSYMAVTLPTTAGLPMGWTIGLATDNGKTMSVQVNGSAGGSILEPVRGGVSSGSITLGTGQNYEYLQLQFDGSNFRVMSATPQTLNNLGGLISPGTPTTSSASCNTGQVQADSNYIYVCTAPNSWKRTALGAF